MSRKNGHFETKVVKLWFHKTETVFVRGNSVRKGTMITRGFYRGRYNVHRWMPHSRSGAHYTVKPTDAWREDDFIQREVEIRRFVAEEA